MILESNGLLGSGKTLLTTALGYDDKLDGQKIFANFWISFGEKINPLALMRFELEDCTVLLAEAHTFLDSRNAGSIASKLCSYFILQSRHRDVNIYYDTQTEHQVDKRLKDVTDYKFICSPRRLDTKTRIYHDDFEYSILYAGNVLTSFKLKWKDASDNYFDKFRSKDIIIPFALDKDAINFDEIITDFKASPTKSSFSHLIKRTYPQLSIEDISACYDFINSEDIDRAKRVLFGVC